MSEVTFLVCRRPLRLEPAAAARSLCVLFCLSLFMLIRPVHRGSKAAKSGMRIGEWNWWFWGVLWIEFQIPVTQVVIESQLFIEVGAVLDQRLD